MGMSAVEWNYIRLLKAWLAATDVHQFNARSRSFDIDYSLDSDLIAIGAESYAEARMSFSQEIAK